MSTTPEYLAPVLPRKVVQRGQLSDSRLPTMYDLPSEDKENEPGLPDLFHDYQADLLSETFRLPAHPSERVLTAADLNLYFDPHHPQWYKRPDWYAVIGVPHLYDGWDLRLSYVVWDEQVSPSIVVEFLSPSSAAEDHGRTRQQSGHPPTKWQVYEQHLKIPYYFLFDRRTEILEGFKLTRGRYQPLDIVDNRLWLPEFEIGLGLWSGVYQEASRGWLRWYDAQGEWLPTPLESERLAKERERLAKEQERLAKEQAQQQLFDTARRLLPLLEDAAISQATGLELTVIQQLRQES